MDEWDDFDDFSGYDHDNNCEICGTLIASHYRYCYNHAFNNCKCGNSKRREWETCKICFHKQRDNEKRTKFGSSNCPICGGEFLFSEFLHTAIPDDKTRLIANLITHYRHVHQSSWNKSCHFISIQYGQDAYEKAKNEHNNRAKRQILRKCTKWIEENHLNAQNFLELKDNDADTIKLIEKTFANKS